MVRPAMRPVFSQGQNYFVPFGPYFFFFFFFTKLNRWNHLLKKAIGKPGAFSQDCEEPCRLLQAIGEPGAFSQASEEPWRHLQVFGKPSALS